MLGNVDNTAMTELPISPLARRIAEENNVNWRALQGSDAGGGVNERDVLNYLEQVMLGTKPVDPTPEPLPEGMTAWAEEPLRAEGQTDQVSDQVTNDDAAQPSDEALEAVYQKMFAELGALKTAAAETERARDAAEQARTEAHAELGRLRETLSRKETELAEREADLSGAQAQVAQLNTAADAREAKAREGQLELERLRETVHAQDEELVEVHTLKRQVEELQAKLGEAQAQAKALQEHSYGLSESLNGANDAAQKAKAETERLRAAHAGLEQTVTELKQRPWWKLWG